MEKIVDALRRIANEHLTLRSEQRIREKYDAVIRFADAHAHMGHLSPRLDVFWDNDKENRKVCQMLHEAGILTSVVNNNDEDITEAVLGDKPQTNHRIEPNSGILSLYLSWE